VALVVLTLTIVGIPHSVLGTLLFVLVAWVVAVSRGRSRSSVAVGSRETDEHADASV